MNFKTIKNFLYYNWIKLASVVFVIVFAFVTLRQCSQRQETDLGILYVGEAVVSDKLPHLAEEVKSADIAKDADGDGVISVNSKAIRIPESKNDMMVQQVPEQIQVEIISGENLLYILDYETLIAYAVDESFADIGKLLEKNGAKEDECLKYDDGRIYAIPLENNELLKNLGIETEGMYISVRNYLAEDADKTVNVNALRTAEYILENGGKHNGK